MCPQKMTPDPISPHDLARLIEARAAPTVVDVRSALEFRRGHVPGALHIPFQRAAALAPAIPSPQTEPIVVYCGHGPRAWIAARALRARGFARIVYLAGHWAAWKRARLP